MPRPRKSPEGIYWQHLEDTERKLITSALNLHNHAIGRAAQMLGITPRYLAARARALGLKPAEAKSPVPRLPAAPKAGTVGDPT